MPHNVKNIYRGFGRGLALCGTGIYTFVVCMCVFTILLVFQYFSFFLFVKLIIMGSCLPSFLSFFIRSFCCFLFSVPHF